MLLFQGAGKSVGSLDHCYNDACSFALTNWVCLCQFFRWGALSVLLVVRRFENVLSLAIDAL